MKEKQKHILDESIKTQEEAIFEAEQRLLGALVTEDEKKMQLEIIESRRKMLTKLMTEQPDGRVVINLAAIMKGEDPDLILSDSDAIYVPEMIDWVLVQGAVYNPTSIAFREGQTLGYYLDWVGGPTKMADQNDIYVVKASGRTQSKVTMNIPIARGDLIVVPAKSGYHDIPESKRKLE